MRDLECRLGTTLGTKLHDMSSLKAPTNYLLPAGTACTAPACADNPLQPNTLPWNFYFNFCQAVIPIAGTNDCNGAAACQTWANGDAAIGLFTLVQWTDIADGVQMVATGGTPGIGNTPRQMLLTILCPKSGKSDAYPAFVNETDATMQYFFTWNHVAACEGAGGGGGLDVGWILIIVLISLTAAYCVGGVVYMAGVKGARGLEMVPNLTFWKEFPFLVKDGCMFAVGKITRRGTYSSV